MKHKIRIDIDNLTTFYNMEDILLINSKNNFLNCYLKNGQEILIHSTFEYLSTFIDKNLFLIIGNEYIINRAEVKSIKRSDTGSTIQLQTDKKIQIFTNFDSITQNMTFV